MKSENSSNDKENEEIEIKQEKTEPAKKSTQKKSRRSKTELDNSTNCSLKQPKINEQFVKVSKYFSKSAGGKRKRGM